MKKIQIQRRMKKMIVPCDKLSNLPFGFSAEEYTDIIKNKAELGCIERVESKTKSGKVKVKVTTPYWLEQCEDYTDMKPLDAFHREVLFAFISTHEQGYDCVTFNMTLNNLTGNDEKFRVCKNQLEAIETAVRKLMKTIITVDLTKLFEEMPNYQKNYKGSAHLSGYLLPCHIIDAEINGQKTIAVELIAESPLMTVAKIKKQLIAYDLTPLKIAGQNNTPLVMTIKNWTLRRIELIKQRRLNPSIRFESFYTECGIKEANDSTKRNARKIFFETLDSFKSEGIIKDYTLKREGILYLAITILSEKP